MEKLQQERPINHVKRVWEYESEKMNEKNELYMHFTVRDGIRIETYGAESGNATAQQCSQKYRKLERGHHM